jgi:hypothetical protein
MKNEITWQTDMKAALEQAAADKLHVLLDFFNPG